MVNRRRGTRQTTGQGFSGPYGTTAYGDDRREKSGEWEAGVGQVNLRPRAQQMTHPAEEGRGHAPANKGLAPAPRLPRLRRDAGDFGIRIDRNGGWHYQGSP